MTHDTGHTEFDFGGVQRVHGSSDGLFQSLRPHLISLGHHLIQGQDDGSERCQHKPFTFPDMVVYSHLDLLLQLQALLPVLGRHMK